MHELGLAVEVLRQVEAAAAAHPGARVTRMCLRVGDASGVDAELFTFAVESVREGACADAVVEVSRVDGADLVLARLELEGRDVS